MVRVIALDIGSGFTKCYDGAQKIVYPSIYSYRQPNLWEESSTIEAVGEEALEIAQHPNAVVLYPVIDGKPQHSAYIKLAEEALNRLRIRFYEDVCLVTGLPYETGKEDREQIKKLLKDRLGPYELAVYPQSLGTLFDLDLQSATVINIGHGTTEIIIIEKLNILGGISEPLASDYILTNLSNFIQSKYGFKPSVDNLVALVSGKIDSIEAFDRPSVYRKDIESRLQNAIEHLVEKISYDTRYLLNQLPPNLECLSRIVLSGGGSLIVGISEALEGVLNHKALMPADPVFSNVYGFYKMGKRLYG